MSEFSPEQERAIMAYACLGPSGALTEEEIAELVGVNRRTLWEWRQSESFCTAIRKEARRNFVREYGLIIAALVRKAKRGHVPAAKLLLEFDGALVQKHEVEEKGQAAYREIVQTSMLEAERMRLDGLKAMGLTEATADKVIEAIERHGLPESLTSENADKPA